MKLFVTAVAISTVAAEPALAASTFLGLFSEAGRLETKISARSRFGSIAPTETSLSFDVKNFASAGSSGLGTGSLESAGTAFAVTRTVAFDYELITAGFNNHPGNGRDYSGYSSIQANWKSSDPLFVITNTGDTEEALYFQAPTAWAYFDRDQPVSLGFPSLNFAYPQGSVSLTLALDGGALPDRKMHYSTGLNSYSNDYTPFWLRPGETVRVTASGYFSASLFLSSAPEPSAWAMMIGGFGMLGTAARRRKRHSSIRYGFAASST